jgi:hypothetical protein
MPRDDNTRLGITTWPGAACPVPALEWNPACEMTPAGALLSRANLPRRLAPADHDEVYLKVCKLDLDDEGELFRFAERYGHLGTMGEALTGKHRSYSWTYQGLFGHPASNRVVADLTDGGYAAISHLDSESRRRYLETVSDFRWGATCLRDLVKAWRFAHEGIEPERWESPIWTRLSNAELSQASKSGNWALIEPPSTPAAAARLLSHGLSGGLRLFHPQVLVSTGSKDSSDRSPMLTHERPPTLYELCCLQLYNHIVEEASYRTCANEPCGRLFVRQSGRAMAGQYRTRGVKYCSTECARAQAQRQYRRRQRSDS